MLSGQIVSYLIFSLIGGITCYITLFLLTVVFFSEVTYDKKRKKTISIVYSIIKYISIVFGVILFFGLLL